MDQNAYLKSQLSAQELMMVSSTVERNAKSAVAAYLLWWFFGWMGGHRYYMGKTGSAVIMTLLFWIGAPLFFLGGVVGPIITGIWGLVDVFFIHNWLNDNKTIVERDAINQILISKNGGQMPAQANMNFAPAQNGNYGDNYVNTPNQNNYPNNNMNYNQNGYANNGQVNYDQNGYVNNDANQNVAYDQNGYNNNGQVQNNETYDQNQYNDNTNYDNSAAIDNTSYSNPTPVENGNFDNTDNQANFDNNVDSTQATSTDETVANNTVNMNDYVDQKNEADQEYDQASNTEK
ncbi:TM2 domain-containing protein [Companilactobacillus sp.]|uniref:TM2 domain-containing protein n=1 Tax=Companilactobacillus sp. TaxID=2767905 RepID=UPI002639B82C|nr:TM2 domain-containing protein [Companilactobacillus sp.]